MVKNANPTSDNLGLSVSRTLLLIGVGLVINTPVAQAIYVIEQSIGLAICERYKAALNASAPKGAFMTERPLSSSAAFKEPAWTRVPEEFPSDSVVEFFWNRDANPAWSLVFPHEWSAWRGTKAQIEQSKENFITRIGTVNTGYDQSVSFRVASVDIDNDGQSEPVVQFSVDPLARLLIVLTPDGHEIDRKKSALVLRHPAWWKKSSAAFRKKRVGVSFNPAFESVGLEPIEDALHGAFYGVFTYEDASYFDLWWLENPARARSEPPGEDQWRLSVFKAEKNRTTKVCTLRFEGESK